MERIPIFELKDDRVVVEFINDGEAYLGVEKYEITYREFNNYLKKGVEKQEDGDVLADLYGRLKADYNIHTLPNNVVRWKLKTGKLVVTEYVDLGGVDGVYEVVVGLTLGTDNLCEVRGVYKYKGLVYRKERTKDSLEFEEGLQEKLEKKVGEEGITVTDYLRDRDGGLGSRLKKIIG